MDERISQATKDLSLKSGASEGIIHKVQNELNIILPDDYIEFMKYSNGAEGPIGEQEYIVLWTIEEIPKLNKAYRVEDFAPGLLLFGSDGGGEAYAFDTTPNEMPIVQVPFVGMSLKEAIWRGNSFLEFLSSLSK